MATMSTTQATQQSQSTLPTLTLPELDPETAARATLSLLETRLRRIEFLLSGISDSTGRPILSLSTDQQPANVLQHAHPEIQHDHTPSKSTVEIQDSSTSRSTQKTMQSRLQDLEISLTKLKHLDGLPGNLVRSIDTLYKRNPEIFSSLISRTTTPSSTQQQTSDDKTTSPPLLLHQSNIVLSHIPTYHAHSSALQTLTTLPIPPASSSTNLIHASPRLKALLARQDRLEREAGELRSRSARVLEWWVKVGVLGMGEVWEGWEERVEDMENLMRRVEFRMREEEQINS